MFNWKMPEQDQQAVRFIIRKKCSNYFEMHFHYSFEMYISYYNPHSIIIILA